MSERKMIKVEGSFYSGASFIQETYGVNADRLKKWREGKGLVKHKLRTIQLDKNYLYNIDDVITLLTNHIELLKQKENKKLC